MGKSLAELRQSGTSRPERSYSLCLAAGLVAEVQELTEELATIALDRRKQKSSDDEQSGPPRRAGERVESPRETEINNRIEALLVEMEDATGELRLRAIPNGEWQRFVNDNPSRDEGEAGYERDSEVTAGYCNADALLGDLGRYVHTWESRPLEAGDWDWLSEQAAFADLKEIAKTIVQMHEVVADLPKWQAALRGTRRSGNDS